MAIQRQNILSLIGGKRYHSCILTTFSYDFYFFEMKVMKWLRSSGVRNVNVLMDGHFYSDLMSNCTGDEMRFSPAYSIYPIFRKNIFHPKVWLFFGEQEALVILGSGNLTNGGNGNNEEIWGAFHFDVLSKENLEIFSAVWNYIKGITQDFKGIVGEKTTNWIYEQSKWLDAMPVSRTGVFFSNNRSSIALLANTSSTTIWEQLLNLLDGEKITELTCISPFYDTDGAVLEALLSSFPKAICNIVVDTSGLIPFKFPGNKRVSFFDWREVGISVDKQARLHAKAIHFKTSGMNEYLLFGSANVTPEGIGLNGIKNANAEASFLVQKENANFLSLLGIKLSPTKKMKLSEFDVSPYTSIFQSILKNNQYQIKILSAEIIYDHLNVYSISSFKGGCIIKLFDSNNQLLSSFPKEEYSSEMSLKISDPQICRFLQFYSSENGEVLSNKIIAVDYFLLLKTHPNPKTEDIERIYGEIQNGEVAKVLDLLPFAIIDDAEAEEDYVIQKSAATRIEGVQNQPEQLYDLSTYKTISNSISEKNLLFSSPSLRVLDIIKFINSKEFKINSEADLRIDEQQEDLADITGNEEDEVPKERHLTKAILLSERKKLVNYFCNLYYHFNCILYTTPECESDVVRRKQLIEKNREYKVTITDLTRYLISIELMLGFGNKTGKYTDNNKQVVFQYLPFASSDEYYELNNVKGCCLNIVGDFLMLMKRGFKKYEFEYTIKRLDHLKFDALVSTLVCVMNNKWTEDEQYYLKPLLLNALHYLGCNKFQDFKTYLPVYLDDIEKRMATLKDLSPFFKFNLSYFKNRICVAYSQTLKRRETLDFDTIAEPGRIVYTAIFGYCYLKSVNKNGGFSLIRPGFMWDDNHDDFIRHQADVVYSPIKPPSFILLNV